jgi:hypothetical protein
MRQDLITTLENAEAELAALHAIPEDDMTAEQLAQYQSLDRQIISLKQSIDQGE